MCTLQLHEGSRERACAVTHVLDHTSLRSSVHLRHARDLNIDSKLHRIKRKHREILLAELRRGLPGAHTSFLLGGGSDLRALSADLRAVWRSGHSHSVVAYSGQPLLQTPVPDKADRAKKRDIKVSISNVEPFVPFAGRLALMSVAESCSCG
jgi:hypothetical protein